MTAPTEVARADTTEHSAPSTGHGTTSTRSSLPEPGERGRLDLADRVIERTVAAAVSEVDSAAGVTRTVLGMSLGSTDLDTAARSDVARHGDKVDVRVTVSVEWPRSIRTVTDAVRSHIRDTVHRTTGLSVELVDIEVARVVTDTGDAAPRVV